MPPPPSFSTMRKREMVWPITVSESYVGDLGKSKKGWGQSPEDATDAVTANPEEMHRRITNQKSPLHPGVGECFACTVQILRRSSEIWSQVRQRHLRLYRWPPPEFPAVPLA